MGAWIETLSLNHVLLLHLVALRVGAWIETIQVDVPEWVPIVALRVGAWIETIPINVESELANCRTPCGCVD